MIGAGDLRGVVQVAGEGLAGGAERKGGEVTGGGGVVRS